MLATTVNETTSDMPRPSAKKLSGPESRPSGLSLPRDCEPRSETGPSQRHQGVTFGRTAERQHRSKADHGSCTEPTARPCRRPALRYSLGREPR